MVKNDVGEKTCGKMKVGDSEPILAIQSLLQERIAENEPAKTAENEPAKKLQKVANLADPIDRVVRALGRRVEAAHRRPVLAVHVRPPRHEDRRLDAVPRRERPPRGQHELVNLWSRDLTCASLYSVYNFWGSKLRKPARYYFEIWNC